MLAWLNFDLKGKNTEAVSINASVASTDLSMLAKNINEYASQTGLTAVLTSDFKQIIIESQDGYNINFKNITDHFHMVKELEDKHGHRFKVRFTNIEKFNEEHYELSELLQSYRKGEVTRFYGNNVIDEIENSMNTLAHFESRMFDEF